MSLADFLYTVAIPVALATVMLGMGLSLTLEDLKRVVLYPKAVGTGLLGQLILLPLLAFVLATMLAPNPAYRGRCDHASGLPRGRHIECIHVCRAS